MANTAASYVKLNNGNDVITLVQGLFEAGWSMTFQDKITYLPLGDTDFDWTSRSSSEKVQVLEEIRKKADRGEDIGLEITFEDSGAEILFAARSASLCFGWSINTRRNPGGKCDFDWYVTKIKPVIDKFGFGLISSFEHDSAGQILVERVD